MRMHYAGLVLTLPSATQETPAALLNDFLLDVPIRLKQVIEKSGGRLLSRRGQSQN